MDGHLAVVNAGGWGTALAILLASGGHEVRLWCRRPALAAEIVATRLNAAYLPGVTLPLAVAATDSLSDAVDGARAVVLVPISRAMRETAAAVAGCLGRDVPVLH